ncbi:MAG: type III-A CRISPR-associated RAMP protein Csm3 [Prevotella sp.]|nr:type III-A CRISPR-associated RAMP protein Csm3 [Prevotella sp.]
MSKLIKKIKLEYTITLLSGLHIGGSKENVEIGGIDLPVIKLTSQNNQPYIPGSSLRGKIRCLLEQSKGANEVGIDDDVNKLFGYSEKDIPSRLIVRDAMLTENSIKMLESCDNLDMPFTENKFENTIDRKTGKAGSPRQIERVPAGAQFKATFIINVFEGDKVSEQDQRKLLQDGINLLQADYLGGSGSRGYGQVKFSGPAEKVMTENDNWKWKEVSNENAKIDK